MGPFPEGLLEKHVDSMRVSQRKWASIKTEKISRFNAVKLPASSPIEAFSARQVVPACHILDLRYAL